MKCREKITDRGIMSTLRRHCETSQGQKDFASAIVVAMRSSVGGTKKLPFRFCSSLGVVSRLRRVKSKAPALPQVWRFAFSCGVARTLRAERGAKESNIRS
jgi:hypothetical protein